MSKRKHPKTRYHKILFDKEQPFNSKIEAPKKGKGSYKREHSKINIEEYKDGEG